VLRASHLEPVAAEVAHQVLGHRPEYAFQVAAKATERLYGLAHGIGARFNGPRLRVGNRLRDVGHVCSYPLTRVVLPDLPSSPIYTVLRARTRAHIDGDNVRKWQKWQW